MSWSRPRNLKIWLSKTFNVFEILYILVRWFNFNILHVMNLSIIVNYICIRNHLCRVFSYVSKLEECVFYTLKLLKSIFIVVGKIKILYLDRGSIAFSLNKYLNLVFLNGSIWFSFHIKSNFIPKILSDLCQISLQTDNVWIIFT